MRTQCRFHLSSPVVTIEVMAIFIASQPIKIHTIDLSQVDKRVNALVSVKKNHTIYMFSELKTSSAFAFLFIFFIFYFFLGGGDD